MEKLAELLNKLLNKWWKPRNREKTLHIDCYDKCKWLNYKRIHLDGWFMNEESRTLRELVSIDSGLWQFCVENELVKMDIWDFKRTYNFVLDYIDVYQDDFQYRLIESAMKDESELESFLIENIKV